MELNGKRTWVTINVQELRNNARKVRSLIPGSCKMMSVIKADAYGHGAEVAARAFYDYTDMYAVSNIDEAIQVRKVIDDKPILILGYTAPEDMHDLVEYRISQTVYSLEYAETLNRIVSEKVTVHFKIDTGMNRLGFPARSEESLEASAKEIAHICGTMKNLDPEGIFTHFAVADEDDGEAFTRTQFSRFVKETEYLESLGIKFRIRHCCNSAATVNYPEMSLDMVRPGIVLYGITPFTRKRDPEVYPAMELRSKISFVHSIFPGDTVSYGRHFTAEKETKIATVAIGYADGLPRALSDRASFLINGRPAPVAGRICMDQCMVVTDGIETKPNDEAVIFGKSGDRFIGADEVADIAGMIPYEIICNIGKRVPRVYISE